MTSPVTGDPQNVLTRSIFYFTVLKISKPRLEIKW
jgi:hypothetical protein